LASLLVLFEIADGHRARGDGGSRSDRLFPEAKAAALLRDESVHQETPTDEAHPTTAGELLNKLIISL
jgi:hypothetical protein